MTLPNSSTPHSFTEEQSSSTKSCFHDSDSSDKENELIEVESTIPSIKSWEMLDLFLQSVHVLPNEEDVIYVVTEYRPLSNSSFSGHLTMFLKLK